MPLKDFFNKVTGAPVNQDGYDDNYDSDYYNSFGGDGYDDQGAEDDQMAGMQMPQGSPMGAQPQTGAALGGVSLSGTQIEVKVVRPERFESVPLIANHLLNKRTVVLNLENTNKENARRIIDFLSGVAFSIDGNLRKIANNAYVITPNNVEVSSDSMRAEQKKRDTSADDDSDPFSDIN